jgi:OOP family OmpA-OmpF porin
MKKLFTVIASIFLLLAGEGTSLSQDFKGSKDHPILSRMPDFRISDYKEAEFNSYRFIGGDKMPTMIEGHKYYIEYKLNTGIPEPGELKIRKNVQEALKKIGGKVIFDDSFNKVSTIVVQKDGKETWLEVRSFNNMYRLNIVERAAMKQELTANADAMGNDINNSGHVAVYGINFETGKSDINQTSAEAISEISKLLTKDKSLKLYVVGHTDNAGTLDANLKLSKERAESVVNSLVANYQIAADRLKSFGVASLVPVATNSTEEGRAKNRRVELVKQ